jgi:integrase
MLITAVSEDMCLAWATKERGAVSTNYFNNLLSFLKQVLEAAIAMHMERTSVLIANPASTIKRSPKRRRGTLDLPDKALFQKVLEAIRERGSRDAEDCIDLAEFLAYSGARVYSEAAWVKWQDVDWKNMELTFRGDPENGLKWRQPGETRVLGINKSLERLLRRLEANQPSRKPNDNVLKVKACDGQLEWACLKLGIPKLTHHKLRHWFGTRCAEEGVGPEVIGEFLGHRDRGVTALKDYVEPSQKHIKSVAIKLALI